MSRIDDGGGGLSLDPLLLELLKKIPQASAGWPEGQRLRWFRTFAMNVSQIYDADDAPVELSISVNRAYALADAMIAEGHTWTYCR